MAKQSIERGIKHDTELEVSFGAWTPQPSTVKGDIVAFGILAGSTDTAKSLTPARTTMEDSIDENRRNQPRSH